MTQAGANALLHATGRTMRVQGAWRHWPGAGEPVLFLHGFAGTAESWSLVVAAMPELDAWAWTLPGHGGQDLNPGGLPGAADVLEQALKQQWGDRPLSVVGYSLGGRLALHLALQHPKRVHRLALLGSSPGILDEAQRQARENTDRAWAKQLEEEGLEAFVEAWEKQSLFQGLKQLTPERAAFWRAQRGPKWQNPSSLAQAILAFSPGRQKPLQAHLGKLDCPTLWLAGAKDLHYAALLPAWAKEQGSQANWSLLPDVGHALPVEAPLVLAQMLQCFFKAQQDAHQNNTLHGGLI